MITDNEIKHFITKIPPTPDVLKQTLMFVNNGELTKAANIAEKDPALASFLKDIVNRPIYGFKTEVSKLSQIFGILGIASAQQILYQYMMSLLVPDKFTLFHLHEGSFTTLQVELNFEWNKILKHLKVDDKDIAAAITLLPSTIIVCEALFSSHIEEVKLLRSVKQLDFNTILKRLSGKDFFDIVTFIAKKWELSEKISEIIYAASGTRKMKSQSAMILGAWMHLLIFQILSKSEFIQAGLNDFIDFNVEYVTPIYEEYTQLMEIS